MAKSNKLIWFRTDLRVHDNPALYAAAQAGPTIGLFIVSPGQWRKHGDADAKVDFWLRALVALQQQLAAINIPLKLLVIDKWDEVPNALVEFIHTYDVNEIHCNREHGVNERRRDRAVYKLLAEHGCTLTGHHGYTMLVPGSIKTGSDSYYKVFTPFSKACKARLRESPYFITPCPAPQDTRHLPEADTLITHLEGFDSPSDEIKRRWPVDSDAIEARMESFVDQRINNYKIDRDFPAIDGTSTMSAYLAAGLVSAGQCLHAALNVNHGELDTGSAGVVTWINELLWREFYQHLLYAYPHLSMHQPMRPETAAVQWRNSTDEFDAWCNGRTGIPIVDAAMKQLVATGWMHNRLRMIVAMFLTKNLLVDWRWGEAFFMRHLIDGELAANNGGWQWSASTGADSAPYFRVFNPVSQSEKFDPTGVFIRAWLPELSGLSNKDIHYPSPVSRAATGYPESIVDLRSSRVRAIEAFSSLR